jgi:predicted MPP superfamily phosphohydrolase
MNTIVHLSDIHFRSNWDENHGVVFRAFFNDLSRQLEQIGPSNVYLVISGDVVMAGGESELYNDFLLKFDTELTKLGISKSHRICVPGNHDVSTKAIELRGIDHEGVIAQCLDETSFNDYTENPSAVFNSKFDNYRSFEAAFSDYNTVSHSPTGGGWELCDNVGVFCLNSAFFSSGAVKDSNGNRLKDKGRLGINTRSLHAWSKDCKAHCKILIMHHPISWLIPWAQREIGALLNNDFKLCLSGHAHDQSMFHSVKPGRYLIEVSAPPLFTTKKDELGYSVIRISSSNEIFDITYRQWTKHHSFVPGVNFSNTEDGKIVISGQSPHLSTIPKSMPAHKDGVYEYLTNQLHESLLAFPSQPEVWVDPIISNCSEYDRDQKCETKITIADIIDNPRSIIIKAPPQFGLTCLAHRLAQQAWQREPGSLWLCLDSRMLTPSQSTIKRVTNKNLQNIGCNFEDIKCVILDSWQIDEKNSYKILKYTCEYFDGIPVVVMQSVNNIGIITSQQEERIERKFEYLYLWALSREHIRTVVNSYNDKRHIGDEDAVILKVVSDIDALNIHRTPLNCLTVLKASEVDFDESPVNRTEMLRRVLFLIFNADDIPTYKTKPDMKDCEFVLGYFCEILLRSNEFFFSRENFIYALNGFCRKCVMALDVERVFDVLFKNHIIVSFGSYFCFKFTYWIYYFLAQRMHHDDEFTKFIYLNMHYARFPEVIEFYTGIDRRREDALNVLIVDLQRGNSAVQKMCGLPDDINPYKFIQWKPAPRELEMMQDEVRNGVSSSNLPETIKDRYADKDYDKRCPYHQDVRNILAGDSLISLMLSMKAAARALRNSDYVNPTVKRALLREIMSGWKEITKVLFVLSPLLTEKGSASLDGSISFVLSENFSENLESRFREILIRIPYNIVNWYKDDIYSEKMGPLLFEHVAREDDAIKKHELIMLLIAQRPRGWEDPVKKYIEENNKNSYYLYDITVMLRHQYEYSYASPSELKGIEYLIKMSAVKHNIGTKKPGIKAIQKVPDDILPERNLD